MIGLDTTFLIDFLKGDNGAVKKAKDLSSQNLLTTQINVYEVLVGLYLIKAKKERFDAFYGLLDKLTSFTLDPNSTELSARLFGELMRSGKRVEQNDCMVAGILRGRGCKKIVTRNSSDFKKLGMEVVGY